MHFKPFWLGILVCFLLGCSTKLNDPIEGQQINSIQINSFDEAFFALDTNQITIGIASLYKNYPSFSQDYFSKLLQLDPHRDTLKIKNFYRQYHAVFNKIQSYAIPAKINNDINKTFTRFHYYFPNYTIPTKLVYYISPSGSYSNVLGVDYIGVGLQDFNQKEAIFQVPMRCVQNLLEDYWVKQQPAKTLLYQMIETGKSQYILNTICLNTPDTLLWNYSSIQLKTVQEQESDIWQFLKDQSMLMSNERIDLLNILGDASHNSLLGAPLPGNIGKYIGYKIVEAYMKKQNNLSANNLQKLISTPAAEIYANANYQP